MHEDIDVHCRSIQAERSPTRNTYIYPQVTIILISIITMASMPYKFHE